MLASLSLDLDNQWSYMKTHGDAGWEALPSYLDIVVPRVLEMLRKRNLTITWFIVGQDAALDKNRAALKRIVEAGHEIGNHSFHHEPWLHLYSEEQIREEFEKAERAIADATGAKPIGFRGPGFSLSPTVLKVLKDRGYEYDCSTFPTFLGPIARWYYFAKSKGLSDEERNKRAQLFGKFREGFKPLKAYEWPLANGPLTEIPVTTMPIFKVPIHLSYVLYLAGYSKFIAKSYFKWALRLCKLTGVEPSILLHPLDFMGVEDKVGLEFFPAMKQSFEGKCELAGWMFDQLQRRFQVVPMRDHADAVKARANRAAKPYRIAGKVAGTV